MEAKEGKGSKLDARSIIKGWLEEHGYDGLTNDKGCFGCSLGDVFLCGCDWSDCVPAYAVPKNCPNCDSPCDGYEEGKAGLTGECYTTRKPARALKTPLEKERVLAKYPGATVCVDTEDGQSLLIVAPGLILSDSYDEEEDAWADAAWRIGVGTDGVPEVEG